MQEGHWHQLTRAFSGDALEWRVTELSEDRAQARVRPQLGYYHVITRLNEVLSPLGWSNRYYALGATAVGCELTIGEVTKASAAPLGGPHENGVRASNDAFVYSAELFGLLPPADVDTPYWVDYDAEHGTPLHEPKPAPATDPPPAPLSEKPAGQQAIDRLVERLRQEGMGLEVAKLVTDYGGYGEDVEAARELYSKLRALLLQKEGAPPL